MAKKYYKLVLKLKNGARVSPFMPKETGLRRTYMANGEAVAVDGGFIFTNAIAVLDFIDFIGPNELANCEVWECGISMKTKAPRFYVGLKGTPPFDPEITAALKAVKKLIDEGAQKLPDDWEGRNYWSVGYYSGGQMKYWDDKGSSHFANGILLQKRREDLEEQIKEA